MQNILPLRMEATLDMWAFVLVSVPTMTVLGLRHALDVDHITAIDNMVRLHNASKKSKWVGAGFGTGHMISVLGEMVFLIFVLGSLTVAIEPAFLGGIVGASALGVIGALNIYGMKKWGKTGSAILASKVLARTGSYNPFVSSMITGVVFGLGFDTATQISALTLSAVTSASSGIQVSLMLAGVFAVGMIPLDALDSMLLRSAFAKIFNSKGFRYMSYALSAVAIAFAFLATYENFTGTELLPELAGPVLAGGVVATSFVYALAKRTKQGSKVVIDRASQDESKN